MCDEKSEPARRQRVPEKAAWIDQRMASRIVAEVLHERFLFPAALNTKVDSAASEIASRLCEYNLETCRLYWGDGKGRA